MPLTASCHTVAQAANVVMGLFLFDGGVNEESGT